MKFEMKTGTGSKGREVGEDGGFAENLDGLEETLKEFRLSVHAWSESACNGTRRLPVAATHRRVLRLAAGWALSCALLAGGLSGGVWEHLHRQKLAHIAAARVAEQARLAAEQRRQQLQENEEEELLAKVDSDVSREVPSAMEPLARLMAGETQ